MFNFKNKQLKEKMQQAKLQYGELGNLLLRNGYSPAQVAELLKYTAMVGSGKMTAQELAEKMRAMQSANEWKDL